MKTMHLVATGCTAADPEARYRRAEAAIWNELHSSFEAYSQTWGSLEEGAMILAEEVDELWDEVRRNHIGRARSEAIQVGAMAVRFIADLYEHSGATALDRGRAAAAQAHRARHLVGPRERVLASSHEAFGFLRREYDALWAAIRFDDPAGEPAARVAAMSVRFIAEITSAPAAAAQDALR